MIKVLDIRFLLLFSTFIFISTASGQSTIRISASGLFPVGEYGEADKGGAGTGFGFGLNWDYRMHSEWLYLDAGLRFAYNPTSLAADKYMEEELGRITNYMDFKNYTATFGPKVLLKTDSELSFSVGTALAINVLNISDFGFSYIYGITPDPNDPTGPALPLYDVAVFSFDPALGIGFTLDLDTHIGERIGATFSYSWLGNYEVVGELESSTNDPISFVAGQKVSQIGIGAFYRLIK